MAENLFDELSEPIQHGIRELGWARPMPVQEKVLPVITQVAFAAFSRIQADAERVKRNVLRALRMVSLGGFPAFLGLVSLALVSSDRKLPWDRMPPRPPAP